jgi:tetratricopeptide (TPR) repeat protein
MDLVEVDSNENNSDADTIFQMVNLCIDVKAYDLGIKNLELGLELYPEDFEFYNLMGYLLALQNKITDGLKYFLKAKSLIDKNGKTEHCYFKIGNLNSIIACYLELGHNKKALECLNSILFHHGDLVIHHIANAYYQRACIYDKFGLTAQAEIDLNNSLTVLHELAKEPEFEDIYSLSDKIKQMQDLANL